jgi:hypothetical protein
MRAQIFSAKAKLAEISIEAPLDQHWRQPLITILGRGQRWRTAG